MKTIGLLGGTGRWQYLALTLLFTVSFLAASNKLIYLIAPPRTLSTVFLRSMYARGDMEVYNEPCEYCFVANHKPEELGPDWGDPPFNTYDKVKQELLRAKEKRHVFAKDTPYAVYQLLYSDQEFLLLEDVEFCFLIRNPHDSLISFHKVLDDEVLSEFDWITELMTYKYLYNLFEKIKEVKGEAPLVISSQDLAAHPESIMLKFCQRVSISYKESMVSWPSLKDSFNPLDWHNYFSFESCMAWYPTVINSTHFESCERHYMVDKNGVPTFIELRKDIRDVVKRIYDYYMIFYTKLLCYAVK